MVYCWMQSSFEFLHLAVSPIHLTWTETTYKQQIFEWSHTRFTLWSTSLTSTIHTLKHKHRLHTLKHKHKLVLVTDDKRKLESSANGDQILHKILFLWPEMVICLNYQRDQLIVIVECHLVIFQPQLDKRCTRCSWYRPSVPIVCSLPPISLSTLSWSHHSYRQPSKKWIWRISLKMRFHLGFAWFVLDFQFNFHFSFSWTSFYNTKHLCSWLLIQGSVML